MSIRQETVPNKYRFMLLSGSLNLLIESFLDIGSGNIGIDRNVESLEFYGYDRPFEVVDTHNNGHSLVVSGFNHHQQAISGERKQDRILFF